MATKKTKIVRVSGPMKKESAGTAGVRWDLSNVYKGLDSKEFTADWKKLEKLLVEMDSFFRKNGIKKTAKPPAADSKTAAILARAVDMFNEAIKLYQTLESYVYSFYSTDSYDKLAAKRMSEIEKLTVPIKNLDVLLQGFAGSIGKSIPKLAGMNGMLKSHEFFLKESAEQSRYLMSEAEESLAAELSLSGGQAFSKLQGVVSSQLKVPVEIKGRTESMPIAKVRNLAYDKDEKVRRAAYEAELKGWESVREPIAASLNGVKGHSITLNIHRGRKNAIHSSLDMNRIDEKVLKALTTAMKESFPLFRRYFRKKASRFGQKALAWWNLFAPAGKSEKRYSYKEAWKFIVDNFSTFSPELGKFADRAFKNSWIDADPRDGKRGGAFCMEVPKVDESRILCNFDGSFEQVNTIAHELGHAYHNECQKGLTMLQKNTPMALAETASIFCETIVTNAAMKGAGREEKLAILETQLINASQVIVDIYSRYTFEDEVFRRREKSELSADEFCEIMINAQKATYGDGLDPKYLHGYMWALKPHYYTPGLAFYNYPYAFGLLFGLGLYEIFEKEGRNFIPKYNELLRLTGQFKAAELTKRFGIDIASPGFWRRSLRVVEAQIDEYVKL